MDTGSFYRYEIVNERVGVDIVEDDRRKQRIKNYQNDQLQRVLQNNQHKRFNVDIRKLEKQRDQSLPKLDGTAQHLSLRSRFNRKIALNGLRSLSPITIKKKNNNFNFKFIEEQQKEQEIIKSNSKQKQYQTDRNIIENTFNILDEIIQEEQNQYKNESKQFKANLKQIADNYSPQLIYQIDSLNNLPQEVESVQITHQIIQEQNYKNVFGADVYNQKLQGRVFNPINYKVKPNLKNIYVDSQNKRDYFMYLTLNLKIKDQNQYIKLQSLTQVIKNGKILQGFYRLNLYPFQETMQEEQAGLSNFQQQLKIKDFMQKLKNSKILPVQEVFMNIRIGQIIQGQVNQDFNIQEIKGQNQYQVPEIQLIQNKNIILKHRRVKQNSIQQNDDKLKCLQLQNVSENNDIEENRGSMSRVSQKILQEKFKPYCSQQDIIFKTKLNQKYMSQSQQHICDQNQQQNMNIIKQPQQKQIIQENIFSKLSNQKENESEYDNLSQMGTTINYNSFHKQMEQSLKIQKSINHTISPSASTSNFQFSQNMLNSINLSGQYQNNNQNKNMLNNRQKSVNFNYLSQSFIPTKRSCANLPQIDKMYQSNKCGKIQVQCQIQENTQSGIQKQLNSSRYTINSKQKQQQNNQSNQKIKSLINL